MAEAKATLVTKRVWDDGKKIHVIGTLGISAGPDTYTAGGIAFDSLVNVVDGANLGIAMIGTPSQPFYFNIVGGSYFGQYSASTKKLKVLVIAGGTEVAAGAVPAGLSSDVITAYFIYDKMS